MKRIFLFSLLLLMYYHQSRCYAQTFAYKADYLVDSLDLTVLSKAERIHLDTSLALYHKATHDTTKLRLMEHIIGECNNVKVKPKYNLFLKQMAERGLASNPTGAVKQAMQKAFAHTFFNTGTIFLEDDDYPSALGIFEKSTKLLEEAGDKEGLALALNHIGYTHKLMGNIKSALEYYNRSIKVSEEIDDKWNMAASLNNIAKILSDQGDIPKGLEYYHKSLALLEKIGAKKEIAASLNNIASVYKDFKEYDKALEYFNKSLEMREEIGDQKAIAISLNNIGNLYYEQDNFNKAVEYFEKSLKKREEAGDKRGMSVSLNNLGKVFEKQGDTTKAMDYLQRSLVIKEAIGDRSGICSSMLNIGRINLHQGKVKEAETNALKAMTMAHEMDLVEDIKDAARLLSRVYRKQNKWKEAFAMEEIHITMRDSLMNETNQKAAIKSQFRYDYEKQALADSLSYAAKENLNKAELKRKNMQRNAFIGGFAVVLLFAGVFFTQRNRISKEKKRSDELLLNILPSEVAEELKDKGYADAKQFDEVTVLFTDFKGFTSVAEKLSPQDLVKEINECFSAFDTICGKYGIEKIKTIGDSFMAAGGLPVANKTHAEDVVKAALEIRDFMKNKTFEIRIGIHSGNVVAGIVGIKKFQYDIWGDTVNTASRMESSGEAGEVNISEATYQLIKNDFTCVYRGEIEAKGKGKVKMYFVEFG